MPLSLSASVFIKASATEVFELVATPERLPQWNTSVSTARRVEPGVGVCLGSRAVVTGRLLGQTLESETEVIGFEPPCVFVTRAIRGPRLTTRFRFEDLGVGTRVNVDVSGEVPGGFIGERLAEGFLRTELTASLERLRVIGESG